MQASFVDNGMMKDPKTGKYTLYTERKKRKSEAAAKKKTAKEKKKEAKLKKQAKEELQGFKSMMERVGIYFGSCDHEFEL